MCEFSVQVSRAVITKPKSFVLANTLHLFASVFEINSDMWVTDGSLCNKREEDLLNQLDIAVNTLLFKKDKKKCELQKFAKFLEKQKLFPIDDIAECLHMLLCNLPSSFKVCFLFST